MLKNWTIGSVKLKFIVGLKSLLKMLLKFSWLLSDLEGLLSFGGRADLKRILPQKEKSFPLGMSSLHHLKSNFIH
jgi:hypothetical protein